MAKAPRKRSTSLSQTAEQPSASSSSPAEQSPPSPAEQLPVLSSAAEDQPQRKLKYSREEWEKELSADEPGVSHEAHEQWLRWKARQVTPAQLAEARRLLDTHDDAMAGKQAKVQAKALAKVLAEAQIKTPIETSDGTAKQRPAFGQSTPTFSDSSDSNVTERADEGASGEPKAKTAVRSRKKGIHTRPQQAQARKVLKALYPNGYPTPDEVSNDDLLTAFHYKYEQMIKDGKLKKSFHGEPSPSSVMREVGRKIS